MAAGDDFSAICDLLGIRIAFSPGVAETPIPPAGRQALLAAWGIACTREHELADIRHQLMRARWHRPIDPVVVADQQNDPLRLVLRLAAAELARPLAWRIDEENGAHRQGMLSPTELAILEQAEVGGEQHLALELVLDAAGLAPGYHQLSLEWPDAAGSPPASRCTLIVTPPGCYSSPGLEQDARVWGLSCRLETVRSRRNWGIGDLTDLHQLIGWAAENGAGTVLLAPLLSGPLPANQLHPPLPSSRGFPDPLVLDLEAVADFQESEQIREQVNDPAFQVRLAHLRDPGELALTEVRELKRQMCESLWLHFQGNHLNPDSERGLQFRRFQHAGGQRLHDFALHQALLDQLADQAGDDGAPLPWPAAWTSPTAPEVLDLARMNRERIELHQYLQWQIDLQLAEAGRRSLQLGLKVGLTLSLAADTAPGGFDAWRDNHLYAAGAEVLGDNACTDCVPSGPPVLPAALADLAYEPFIALLRSSMQHAGGLCLEAIERFDRQRLRFPHFPEGAEVLVTPDTESLVGILALESQRNRCLVIAASRGPLRPSLAETLERHRILLGRTAFFSHYPADDCQAPSCSPARAMIQASRADLCPLAASWQGSDLTLLTELCPGFAGTLGEQAVLARSLERAQLLVALRRESLLPQGYDLDPAGVPELTPELLKAVHLFLSRSPAMIQVVHLADLPAECEPENRPDPGLKPAWRQRLALSREALADDEPVRRLFRELCLERGIGVVRPSALLADRRRDQRAIIPRAFYRLQFSRDLTFPAAAALLPYLRDLGISHCYASPYLKARPGSSHGYDIIDHNALNPEIGSREDYETFVSALDRNGMAQILDIVPNHMGVGPDNVWWQDVLENGQASPYADFFDINWHSLVEELKNRVLLPVLGDCFGAVLEAGALRLLFLADRGLFEIAYYEHRYPIAPETYPLILNHDLERLEDRVGGEHEGLLELHSLSASFASLPGGGQLDQELLEARARNKEVLKRLLARLCREHPEIGLFIEENVIYFNGEPDRPRSFDPLEQLLARQAYRLAFWRVASDEINYRRFFDINDLAGLRMERKEVFDRTHSFVLDLIATGKIDGLRVDHADGLYDPAGYFRRLQAAISGRALELQPADEEGLSARERQAALPLYIVAEKILAEFEQLPADWMVHGTSGYDFSRLLGGLFVDQSAEADMTAIYHHFIGTRINCINLVHDCKKRIIETAMAGEINVLSIQLHRLAKQNRYTQDYTLNSLRDALTEIVACFPVYRTYCTADRINDSDRQYVELAVDRAKGGQLVKETSIYDFIRSVLLQESPWQEESANSAAIDFVMKFQQYSGPVMAKGLEDTAFYIYNRLLSLNEVGSDPRTFGVSMAAFHAANQERCRTWPSAMLNTSTHDSKRSEDVRARINVLTEMPAEWREAVSRWHSLNRRKKIPVGQVMAPSKNDEYALYQNLLGIWPLTEMRSDEQARLCTRFTASMLKMIREAKVETSWVNPNQGYEAALSQFIESLLDGSDPLFLDDFLRFARKTARFGMLNSASQLLLKLTVPGVPDIYQGNELFHFCLVDPDNRRPVDFDQRRRLLEEQRQLAADPGLTPAALLEALMRQPAGGGIKLYLLWKTLHCRREHPELFEQGAYFPLYARGAAKEHLCAFGRRYGEQTLIAAVPRLMVRLLERDPARLPLGREVWKDTLLPLSGHLQGRRLRNILTGEELGSENQGTELYAAQLFAHFPWALLLTV